MFNWELIYRKKQHYITIPQKQSRKLFFGNNHLQKILNHQRNNEDIFISKYAVDGIINCLILDFDDANNPKNALKDAKKLKKYTNKKGLNTIIIQSGSKGYHTYTQLPYRAFGKKPIVNGVNRDIWFDKFVEYIINTRQIKYPTLDTINSKAGLGGNIRVIGSKHPKTQNKCTIIEGNFQDDIIPNNYEYDCLQRSYEYAKGDVLNTQIDNINRIRTIQNSRDTDPISENDLRILMPQIFGGETKAYDKGYVMMQCPFHSDSHPSLRIRADFYYCQGCGAKGNWWTLRKLGYVDFEEEEPIRVKKVKT